MSYISHEGVNLHYEEAGSGPAIVFVHGWCCNLSHFGRQFEHFRATHRVVAVDLRGHGESDNPGDDYTMPMFADDVAHVLRHLGIEKAVAVGHSMGGVVVATMAARHPDLVRGVVAVDSPVVATEGSRQRLGPRLEAMAGTAYLAAARDMVAPMFEPYDDPARCEEIMRGMTSMPQHTMVSSMRANLAQDAAAMGTLTQPVLAIMAGRFPFDLEAMRRVAPKLSVAQTYGSGHFNMLEVPEQVNSMIERFLAIETPRA